MAVSKDGEMFVEERPNSLPRMEALYAFVSRDAEGNENLIGSLFGVLGTQPLVTGSPRNLELFKPFARKARETMQAGQTVHLLKFTHREEIDF